MRGSAQSTNARSDLSGTGFKGTMLRITYVNGILWCVVYHSVVNDHSLDDEQIEYGL
jgi:hypothetical protein